MNCPADCCSLSQNTHLSSFCQRSRKVVNNLPGILFNSVCVGFPSTVMNQISNAVIVSARSCNKRKASARDVALEGYGMVFSTFAMCALIISSLFICRVTAAVRLPQNVSMSYERALITRKTNQVAQATFSHYSRFEKAGEWLAVTLSVLAMMPCVGIMIWGMMSDDDQLIEIGEINWLQLTLASTCAFAGYAFAKGVGKLATGFYNDMHANPPHPLQPNERTPIRRREPGEEQELRTIT